MDLAERFIHFILPGFRCCWGTHSGSCDLSRRGFNGIISHFNPLDLISFRLVYLGWNTRVKGAGSCTWSMNCSCIYFCRSSPHLSSQVSQLLRIYFCHSSHLSSQVSLVLAYAAAYFLHLFDSGEPRWTFDIRKRGWAVGGLREQSGTVFRYFPGLQKEAEGFWLRVVFGICC